jgi:putative endonuclease
MYVGVTNDLSRRIAEHKSGAAPGFTKRYKVHHLVHCETFSSIIEARDRERVLKKWRRDWKIELVEMQNPNWRDLTSEIMA